MKTTIIVLLTFMTLSVQAYEYQCKVQNRESNGLKISKLLINPNAPTLTVMNDRDNSRLQLIDDIYLGLLTEPMAWALRSECELTQEIKKNSDGTVNSVKNHFYCLLEDEGSPIGKIDVDLNFDFQKNSGTYLGVAASMVDDVPAKEFRINFSECK